MADPLRACLYDRAAGGDSLLRPAFEKTAGLLLVAEVSSWDELREWLHHGGVDLVAVNLDTAGAAGLDLVRRMAELSPSCGVIGVSSKTDPASIIGAMRAGCSQFVCAPIDLEDLRNAVQRIRANRLTRAMDSKRVCVIGASGGAGATTVACNLAMELAHLTDRRCGLVDLNLEFGDIACAFDCSPPFSVADVCREGLDVDRVLLGKALHDLPCNVSILPRPQRLEDARVVTPGGIENMLRVLDAMLPFTVVDLPRAYSYLSAAAVRDADYVLVVTQLGVPFIRNASRICECLQEMGSSEESVQIVLNRYNSVYDRITPEHVEAHFGKPVFALIPNDYRRVQTALDLGHPIVADSPNTPARLAIQQMARRIAGGPQEEPGPGHLGGLLSRLWARSRREDLKSGSAS